MPRTTGLLCAIFLLVPGLARGASYLPLSDADLASGAPVIVRARVLAGQARSATEDGQEIVLTETRFQPLDVIKGNLDVEEFSVELPGGRIGERSDWVPGTPEFLPGAEVILFLSPAGGEDERRFRLTEFGLSSFEIVADSAGRRFAVRAVFGANEDDLLSSRQALAPLRAGLPHALRDADSFIGSLRAVGAGLTSVALPAVEYAVPLPESRSPGVTPSWVNIGGGEGNNRLYRWFWDTGRSAPARVVASGAQTGLSDGSDGTESVANAARQWSGVSGARVEYSATNGSASVVVNLDVASHGNYWSEPMSCSSGGVIGLGGPGGGATGAGSYKGDGNYAAVTSGGVFMRKVTGGCYSAKTFRSAVLHEVGHTLGLGHSDQAASIHSTTTASERNSAVMTSVIPSSTPSTPQADDIQAILWLYGTGAVTPTSPDRARPSISGGVARTSPPTVGFRP